MGGGWKGRAAELAMHTIVKPVTMLGAPLLQRDLPREVVADFWRHTWDSYARRLREVVIAHRAMPELRALGTPTHVLYAVRDDLADVDRVRRLAALNPAITVDVIPGDHHVAARNPAAVGRVLERMLLDRN